MSDPEPFVVAIDAEIERVRNMTSSVPPPVTPWDKVPPVTEFPLPDPITPPDPPPPPTPNEPPP